MKLYFHPACTTSRPGVLLASEPRMPLDMQVVDRFTGYAASFVALGEITGSDYAAYPKVQAWLGRMKALPSWKDVNAAIDGYAASLKGNPMLAV